MQRTQMQSYILVIVQFLCAGILVYLILPISFTLLPIIMVMIGITIALWAIFSMGIGNFRIQPIPKQDAEFILIGPYRFMSHPMYAAVLLAMLGTTINIGTWLGYAVWLILLIDLIVKMRFEEKLLLRKFPEYEKYMKQTKRILPKVW